MLESKLEKYLVEAVEARKGIAIKLSPIFNKGIPDRLIITLKGEVWFIELKQPEGRQSKMQKYWQIALQEHECNFAILWSMEDIDEFISRTDWRA